MNLIVISVTMSHGYSYLAIAALTVKRNHSLIKNQLPDARNNVIIDVSLGC